MTCPIRFQVLTLAGRPWSEYRDQVKQIEDLGFDMAAVPDHFCDWANPPAPWLECWTLLAALASETTTVRLASNVAQIPLRNPGVLAHQAITVDHISNGRLELGLGTGLMIDPGTEMMGLPNWSNGEAPPETARDHPTLCRASRLTLDPCSKTLSDSSCPSQPCWLLHSS